ncbi:protein son of sevenless-like, partial [Hyposmocoma kahamanoa]|uniref:protein son of sevenless-like n=1 Tax=Hyposmocoma kahamanoa TaxID=1477025 RepID=UPI000E6D7EE3
IGEFSLLELAEVEEFRAYVRYASIVTRKESRDTLQSIVDDPVLSERLDTAGHGFRLAVKYYLPKLLLAPVGHVFLYHNYVLALLQIAPASEDRESFKQVECNLHPIKKSLMKALGNGPKMEATLPMASRARRQQAIEKCGELAKLVENWDNRDIGQCCNEFIREDTLSKIGPGKRIAERRAYLFDGLLLLCKPITGLVTVNASAGSVGGVQLKLKEKLHVRKLELVDRADGEEGRHLLELCPRVGPPVLLACASCAEKRNWMCDLVMLNTKPMLDRSLDSILLDLERRHPLKLPPARLYRFAVPDSPDNIVLEERQHANAGAPLIKGATLLKLVERLTYHIYADLNLVRTFLTTYRSFCSPGELLDLLIERFNIPEPSEVYDAPRQTDSIESLASTDSEKLSKNTTREDWKRYRKEFQQPVKFRVINVLRHWVDQHFYDFEREPALLARLRAFLEGVDGKPMRKWVQSVLKTLQRRVGDDEAGAAGAVAHVFDRLPPAVLRHVHEPERHRWHPLALHPLELARQLTLLEFQLYRQVKPSELVGAVWTKEDKEKSSPNLLKIIKHTTNFTRWMEKWIVESENQDERIAVVSRFLDVAIALRDLNNFNGVLAVVAACGSASVHRLKTTFSLVSVRHLKALEEFRELNNDHFRRYQERLRSINPPCVPFFGMYLTNILHIEVGNQDYLPNSELINFSKRRKVAEITGEIQQYQNQPYCLTVEPKTRAFLESLDPFPGMDEKEIADYLYLKSNEIEPRNQVKPMPKFPRKYPELSLKPVKVSRRHHDSSHHSTANNDDTISISTASQLSPTSGFGSWDGQSVASLPVHHDEHRGSVRSEERVCVVSPVRMEKGNAFSLIDMGLALFDKSKSTASLAAKNSTKDEPPSPRDRHSPKHEKASGCLGKPLVPRNPIVESECYCGTVDHLNSWRHDHSRQSDQAPAQERVPPLLPRTSATEADKPPLVPPRDSTLTNSMASSSPPSPPDRPLPSPKHHDLARMPTTPKRSPAPNPPASPLVQAADRSSQSAFHFPTSPPAPPLTPHPPHLPQTGSACGTPPPLPPRRRKDSVAPPTPHNQPTSTSVSPLAPPAAPLAPPPLPPRPPPAPELLRPAHSTILQRRGRHTNTSNNSTTAPRLPPKPPPAIAPRP